MNKQLRFHLIWLLGVAVAVWLGFADHWSGLAWWRLGFFLSPLPWRWLWHWLPRWHVAALPKSERAAVLAGMKPERREDILKWLAAKPGACPHGN